MTSTALPGPKEPPGTLVLTSIDNKKIFLAPVEEQRAMRAFGFQKTGSRDLTILNPSFFFGREITNYGSEFSRLAAPNNLNRFYFCVNVSHVQLHVTFYCLDVLYTESVNRNEIDSERIQFFLHYLSFTNILHPFEDRIKTQHLSTIGSVTNVFEAPFNTFKNSNLPP